MLVLLLTSVFLLSLLAEKAWHRRRLRALPLRIGVTGTRGKSTVTRLLASVLREDGRRVLAKTTGSEARLILPDGSEVEIRRRGIPTILEQKGLVRRAVRAGADCLVAEMMSIRPENLFVEAHHLLQPNVVAVTNVRADHTEAMGNRPDQVGAALAPAFHPRAAVFVPQSSVRYFGSATGSIEPVPAGISSPLTATHPQLQRQEFQGDLDLVYQVARRLGVSGEVIARGIGKARHDLGRLALWILERGSRRLYLVNAFSANDPESTWEALDKARALLPDSTALAGILNLRSDRPGRTLQWLSELRSGGLGRFAQLYVTGGHAVAARRSVRGLRRIGRASPEEITETVASGLPDRGILFGFGNMAGAGRLIVEYWKRVGEPYAL